MKNRTDLILGEAFCIFIFFYFLDSGLSVLNGLQFYFRLRDSENREYRIGLPFKPKYGDFGANSLTGRRRAAPISKMERATLWYCVNRYSDLLSGSE